jgi:hypothetical protein
VPLKFLGPSRLLLNAILSNFITCLFIFWAIEKETKKSFLALLLGSVFLTSGWVVTYYMMASYAPFSTAIASIQLFFWWLLLNQKLNKEKVNFKYTLECFFIFTYLFILTSPSSLLLIFLEGLPIVYFYQGEVRKRFRYFFYLNLGVFVLLFVLLAPYVIPELAKHYLGNLNTNHYTDSIHAHGFIPRPGFFTFCKILYFYCPTLLFLGLGLYLFWGSQVVLKKQKLNSMTGYLVGILLLHCFLVDVLPFTKLARAQFVIFPLFLISIATCLSSLPNKILKNGLGFILMVALGQNILLSKEIIFARKNCIEVVKSFFPNTFFAFAKDPHAQFYGSMLEVPIKLIKNSSELMSLKKGDVLILGPHGKESGKSLMRHSCLEDFIFDEEELKKIRFGKVSKALFYPYYPSFRLEEEISQSFTFLNLSPDYQKSNFQFSFLQIE